MTNSEFIQKINQLCCIVEASNGGSGMLKDQPDWVRKLVYEIHSEAYRREFGLAS